MILHPIAELSAYIDGELSADEERAVDGHLRDCPACSARLTELRTIDEMAQGLEVQAPEGFFETFPARLRDRLPLRARPRRRLPVWALAAAAALLVAVLTPLSLRERGSRPSVSEMPGPPVPAPAAAPPAESEDTLRRLSETAPRKAERDRELRRRSAGGADPPSSLPAAGVSGEVAAIEEKPPAPAVQEAPVQGPPPPASGRAASAGRARGPWSQVQQSPGAFAPAPSDQATEGSKGERQGKVVFDSVPAPRAEMSPAVALGPSTRREPAEWVGGSATDKEKKLRTESFEGLRERRPQTSGEARSLREDWRRFAARNPNHPRIDEARLAVIEAGALAFRFGRQAEDRIQVEADAEAYLAQAEAPQAERVRALLASLTR